MVNTDRLVQTCIRILGLISDKNLSVNEIIRQTSSDRSHVIEAIKKLEGAALVVENKAREHKQKRIKRLSELGREFKHFMADIEKYNEAFIRFEKSREENFDTLEKSEIQTNSGILRNRGWTEEEVRLREKTWDGIYMMRGIFEKNIFNALVSRYSVLAAEIGDNEVAKDILAKIVTDEVAHQLLIIQRYYQKSVVGALVRNLAFTTVDDLKEFYQSWFANYSLLNHFINSQTKDVIISLIYLFNQPESIKEYIGAQIPMVKDLIKRQEKGTLVKYQVTRDRLRNNRELLDIFKKIQQLP